MEFNITDIAQLSNDQILNRCHDLTTKVPLTIMFFVSIVFFLLFGLILVKESRKKLIQIILYTVLFSGIVFLVLYFMPITVTQAIGDFLNRVF